MTSVSRGALVGFTRQSSNTHTHTHTHRGLGFDHVIGPLSTAAEFHGGPRLFVEHDAEEEDERTLERDRDRERESERDRQRQRERESHTQHQITLRQQPIN